jgi:Swt1-like HEPN
MSAVLPATPMRTKTMIDNDRQAQPDNIRKAIETAWANGMPPLASALYGRWWQLESWLRTLLYVELRAKFGSNWANALPKVSEKRQQGEQELRYMTTPDAQNLLAYTDASVLFNITLEHWALFEDTLLSRSKNVWAGRVEELLAIRNRIGHCRRPHTDDLTRLEQTLRDLNGGAFTAISTFNNQWSVNKEWTDAVTDGWVGEQHNDAVRLIKHAERQYDTVFELRHSSRPWVKLPNEERTISGIPGYIWHAFWYFRGGRSFPLDRFWRRLQYYCDPILLVCSDPSSISVSFSAMEEPQIVADVIGKCFDAALSSIRHGIAGDDCAWQERYKDIDPRVHVLSPWTVVEESMHHHISIFGA